MGFLDDLDKLEKQEQGGGGYFAQVTIGFGYKCYVVGTTNDESIFMFNVGDDDSKKAAYEKALEFYKTHGIESDGDESSKKLIKNLRPSFVLRISKDNVLGRVVTWKDDRVWAYALWTAAYKQVVKPKLVEAGVQDVGTMWAHISFVADPSGAKDKNAQGEEIDKLVAFVSKVYPTKAEILKEAGEADAEPPAPAPTPATPSGVPAGWTKDSWSQVIPDIKKEKDGGKSPAQIATDYGVTVADVMAACRS